MKIQEIKMYEFIKSKPSRLKYFSVSQNILFNILDEDIYMLGDNLYIPTLYGIGKYFLVNTFSNEENTIYRFERINNED